jgi:hypothetical protein
MGSSGGNEKKKNSPINLPHSASSTIQSNDDMDSDGDSLDLIQLAQLPRL